MDDRVRWLAFWRVGAETVLVPDSPRYEMPEREKEWLRSLFRWQCFCGCVGVAFSDEDGVDMFARHLERDH
jgi:hypothetical protein